MQGADDRIEHGKLHHVRHFDRQNTAHQDFLDVLCPLRRTIDNQYRRCSGHDIDDAHECLLEHEARETTAQREQRRANCGEQQGIAESGCAGGRVSARERDCCSQCRELGEREVGKHDFSAQHVNAEISVHENEYDRRSKGQDQQREPFAHRVHCVAGLRGPNALASVATL